MSKQDKQDARDAIETLTRALNGGTRRDVIAGLVQGLSREHRYLQSEAIWALLEALARLPQETGTDARNEHAVNACADVYAALADRIYIPAKEGN